VIAVDGCIFTVRRGQRWRLSIVQGTVNCSKASADLALSLGKIALRGLRSNHFGSGAIGQHTFNKGLR
jgi:hypothetical protein